MSQTSDPLPSNRRNLLFGFFAFQHGLIDRDGLVAAFDCWCHDKEKPLSDILFEQKIISVDERAQLEAQVESRLERHNGPDEVTLASQSAISGFVDSLKEIGDADVQGAL